MKQEPAQFWTTVRIDTQNSIDSQQHRTRLEDRVLTYLYKTHPPIYLGAANAKFTLKDADKLFRQLKRHSQTLEYLYILRHNVRQ